MFEISLHFFLRIKISITDLINMMLLSYPDSPESSTLLYSSQRGIQTGLLGVAVICIPWMLLGNPIYTIVKRRQRKNVT